MERPGLLRTGATLISANTTDLPQGGAVWWQVRPESVRIQAAHGILSTLIDVADLGTLFESTVAIDPDITLESRSVDSPGVPVGAPCGVVMLPSHISVWPRAD